MRITVCVGVEAEKETRDARVSDIDQTAVKADSKVNFQQHKISEK
jgi:hypothetical protein